MFAHVYKCTYVHIHMEAFFFSHLYIESLTWVFT